MWQGSLCTWFLYKPSCYCDLICKSHFHNYDLWIVNLSGVAGFCVCTWFLYEPSWFLWFDLLIPFLQLWLCESKLCSRVLSTCWLYKPRWFFCDLICELHFYNYDSVNLSCVAGFCVHVFLYEHSRFFVSGFVNSIFIIMTRWI